MDGTLTGTTTPGHRVPGNKDNEGVLYTPDSPDAVEWHSQDTSFFGGGIPLQGIASVFYVSSIEWILCREIHSQPVLISTFRIKQDKFQMKYSLYNQTDLTELKGYHNGHPALLNKFGCKPD